jgi:hypothetical protein
MEDNTLRTILNWIIPENNQMHTREEELPENVGGGLPVTKHKRDSNEEVNCSICLENFKLNDNVIKLPCKHEFHPECLNGWLKNKSTCPMCRCEIDTTLYTRTEQQPYSFENDNLLNGWANRFINITEQEPERANDIIGAQITLRGLETRPHLNGMIGTVISHHRDNRYLIRLSTMIGPVSSEESVLSISIRNMRLNRNLGTNRTIINNIGDMIYNSIDNTMSSYLSEAINSSSAHQRTSSNVDNIVRQIMGHNVLPRTWWDESFG